MAEAATTDTASEHPPTTWAEHVQRAESIVKRGAAPMRQIHDTLELKKCGASIYDTMFDIMVDDPSYNATLQAQMPRDAPALQRGRPRSEKEVDNLVKQFEVMNVRFGEEPKIDEPSAEIPRSRAIAQYLQEGKRRKAAKKAKLDVQRAAARAAKKAKAQARNAASDEGKSAENSAAVHGADVLSEQAEQGKVAASAGADMLEPRRSKRNAAAREQTEAKSAATEPTSQQQTTPTEQAAQLAPQQKINNYKIKHIEERVDNPVPTRVIWQTLPIERMEDAYARGDTESMRLIAHEMVGERAGAIGQLKAYHAEYVAQLKADHADHAAKLQADHAKELEAVQAELASARAEGAVTAEALRDAREQLAVRDAMLKQANERIAAHRQRDRSLAELVKKPRQ